MRALSSRTLASQRERQRQSELRRREAEREERSEGGSGGGYSCAQMGRKRRGRMHANRKSVQSFAEAEQNMGVTRL